MTSLRTAFKNIRRSPYQTLMAWIMMSLVFFVSYVVALMLISSQLVLRYFESRPQVIAFFTTTAKPELLDAAATFMKEKPYVEKIRVVTKDDALSMYKEDNKKDPVLLELVNADMFPASIEISAKEIGDLERIKNDVAALEGVEDVIFQKDVVGSLSNGIRTVRIVGVSVITLFGVMSFLFIVVVVSLRVALKRQEIAIMRLLGAGFGYILLPYLFEGSIYGIVGALVGWLGVVTLLLYGMPYVLAFFTPLMSMPFSPMILGVLLAGGIVMGIIVGSLASFLAVKRFVKQ